MCFPIHPNVTNCNRRHAWKLAWRPPFMNPLSHEFFLPPNVLTLDESYPPSRDTAAHVQALFNTGTYIMIHGLDTAEKFGLDSPEYARKPPTMCSDIHSSHFSGTTGVSNYMRPMGTLGLWEKVSEGWTNRPNASWVHGGYLYRRFGGTTKRARILSGPKACPVILEDVLDALVHEEPEPTYDALTRWSALYPEHRDALARFFVTWAMQSNGLGEPAINEESLANRTVSYALNAIHEIQGPSQRSPETRDPRGM